MLVLVLVLVLVVLLLLLLLLLLRGLLQGKPSSRVEGTSAARENGIRSRQE